MLRWLEVVRMADVDSVRWALGAFGGGRPVTHRRAQQWVARLAGAGLVSRVRATFNGGSIVWPTFAAVGRAAPNLYRQTVRHDVAVAAVSVRYLCAGWSWARDRPPAHRGDHQVDGVVTRGSEVELVEVELTTKTLARYAVIFNSHTGRLAREGITRVSYYCDRPTERAIRLQADQRVFSGDRHRVSSYAVFDARGRWEGRESLVASWAGPHESSSTPDHSEDLHE